MFQLKKPLKETSLNSPSVSVLLDKNIVRRVYEYRVRLVMGAIPTVLQAEAVNVYTRLRQRGCRLYLTTETHNVLQLRPPVYAARLLAQTQELRKGRYLRRWARRLRSLTFSREDAVIVAYGSFGVDLVAGARGVQYIVTGDQGMVTNFHTHNATIKDRFEQMTVNLPAPYQAAALPEVLSPHIILTQW